MIAYILESTLALGLFYSLFLLLKNGKSFRFNRFYILGSLLAAFFIPLINIPLALPGTAATASIMLEELVISAEQPLQNNVAAMPYYAWIYVIITVLMATHLVVQILHIHRLKQKNSKEQIDGYTLIKLSGTLTHFSFFKTIFINAFSIDNDRDLKRIIKHEQAHAQQWHSADVLLLEIIKVLCWFNPFVWLFKPLMMHNHEFLADQRVVLQGANKATYLHQIVKHTLTNYNVALVNNFNYSFTKKRLVMMTKQNSKWLSWVKIATILPLGAGIVFFFSCSENVLDSQEDKSVEAQHLSETQEETVVVGRKTKEDNAQTQKEVFMVVEDMPEFEGGEPGDFRYFIAKNLAYPQKAREESIEGKVFIQFVVGADGIVKNAEVVRSAHPLLDAEAIRVVNLSPAWTPGKQKGKNVDVQFTFPINFKLQ